jgi:hypothetical protein
VQGGFIVKEFSMYKDFYNSVKKYLKSKWHCKLTNKANDFCKIVENKNKSNVQLMSSSLLKKKIKSYWKKLIPIIKTIDFCGTKNIPLRGNTDDTAIFNILLEFRIDVGDMTLNDLLLNSSANATYISHRVQWRIVDF